MTRDINMNGSYHTLTIILNYFKLRLRAKSGKLVITSEGMRYVISEEHLDLVVLVT